MKRNSDLIRRETFHKGVAARSAPAQGVKTPSDIPGTYNNSQFKTVPL